MLTKLPSVLRSALVCYLALLAGAAIAQTTIRVGPGQTYTTIQSGIDAASAGDTVLVAPGTYNENISFPYFDIIVTSSNGASATIIDGGNKPGTATVFITNGRTKASLLSGFTIRGGGDDIYSGNINGGVWIAESAAPIIQNNIITANYCHNIQVGSASPTILNNEISGVLQSNISTGVDESYCDFPSAVQISGTPTGIGAGQLTSTVIGNTIENNLTGSAINLWVAQNVLVQNNTIRNNTSPDPGSAFTSENSYGSVVAQNLIYDNTSGCGGAIAFQDYGYPNSLPSILILNNTLVDNVVTRPLNGITNCIDIAQIYPSPDSYGYSDGVTGAIVANNIIAGSTTYPAVNCAWYFPPDIQYQPIFENNTLRNAAGPFFGSFCVDETGINDNITSDPLFTNASKADYHLQAASPAIDAGVNSDVSSLYTQMTGLTLSSDFDGKPRIQNDRGHGCTIDMGIYEYPGTEIGCSNAVSETLTSSLNPAGAGQNVTFTAQLSPSTGKPTGSIQFLDGTVSLSTQSVSNTGSASFTTSNLAVGSHTITANYQPTGNFGAATASLVEVINGDPTTTALTCQPSQIAIGGTAQFIARVTSPNGTPTGSMAFADNTVVVATQTLINGATTLAYTGTTAGSHSIIATYEPSGSFAQGDAANCTETVNALASTSTLAVTPATTTYGSSVQLKATVAPTVPPGAGNPTGTVTFLNGVTVLGTGTLANGAATLTDSGLPGGNYNLSCSYSGSSVYTPSNCAPVSVTIQPVATVLTLTSSKDPAVFSNSIAFTARLTVNGQPAKSGNGIVFTLNGQTIPLSTDSTGSSTYTTAVLPPGTYPVTATFAFTNSLEASSATLTEVITQAPTTTLLSATPNPVDTFQPASLIASVSSSATVPPQGTVTFLQGAFTLGTASLAADGTATLIYHFPLPGNQFLTARYGGNDDFSPSSTATAYEETVLAGDFSIAVTPGAATLYTGQSAGLQVGVDSLQGFNQPLALSCPGLPANTTCTFSPASLPNGQGAATLVIQTSAPHKAAASSKPSFGVAAGVLVFLLIPGIRRRRRLFTAASTVLLAIAFGIGISGCGSTHPITGGTPPGVYQVAVSATTMGSANTLTHSANFTLTVKSLF